MAQQLATFSSAVEKTPTSSSLSDSPEPLKTVVAPDPNSLGFRYVIGIDGWNRSGYCRTPFTMLGQGISLKFNANFQMQSCGACTLQSLDGVLNNEETRQNFVCLFLQLLDITYYALPSTSQLKNPNGIIPILNTIGMVEIGSHPNRLHGPNNMHMMVFDPKSINIEGVKKYCYNEPGSTHWLPLWLKSLSNKEKNSHFEQWTKANALLKNQREEVYQKALSDKRVAPVKEFASVFKYYVELIRNPSRYCPYGPDIMNEIKLLLDHYQIEVK